MYIFLIYDHNYCANFNSFVKTLFLFSIIMNDLSSLFNSVLYDIPRIHSRGLYNIVVNTIRCYHQSRKIVKIYKTIFSILFYCKEC